MDRRTTPAPDPDPDPQKKEAIMNIKSPLFAAALGLAVLSVSAQAAGGKISEDQINTIKAGESKAAVIKTLGQPESSPKWLNGTHSLVYAVADATDATARAYVDVGPDNKVLRVQFGDDGQDN